MAVLRNRLVLVSLLPIFACTFNAGGLGQTGESATGSSSAASSGGPTTDAPTTAGPTTDAPTSVGPGGEMSATGSTGPVDPDTSATGTTAQDTSGTSEPVTGSTTADSTGTTAGDGSSSGGSTGCVEQEFFKDGDGDGYGDPKMASKPSCEPPPGYVEDATDCDDKNNSTNPGAPEKCGMGDNDCDKVVDEFEPDSNPECGGCKMYLYPPNNRVYYFCSMVKSWAESKGECEKRGGVLVKDIDMAHHDWLVNLLPGASGPWWIGATSPNGDSKFTWLDGTLVPVLDARWSFGHPFLLGDDRIVLVSNGNLDMWANDNGRWFDREDFDKQPFLCESAYLP